MPTLFGSQSNHMSEKHATFVFGRFNPPTTGHKKLIDAAIDNAHKQKGDHFIFASHTQDKKKNPLAHKEKVHFMRKMFPHANIDDSNHIKTAIDAAKHLHNKGYTHVHMMVGGDRQQEFHNLLHKYNGGKDYNFKHLEVRSAGDRDPDSEGVDGMSASKMRGHAAKGEFHHFRKGVPSKAEARELYKAVRKGMHLEQISNHKALFIVGGPGSGKDFLINSIISENKIEEISLENVYKASAEVMALPMIINGNAENIDKIQAVKESLESKGFDTAMVYVYTTNEESKARNDERIASGAKTINEETRTKKYQNAVSNIAKYSDIFETFFIFDNSADFDTLTEERQIEISNWIAELEQGISEFFKEKIVENSFDNFRKKLTEQNGTELDNLFEELIAGQDNQPTIDKTIKVDQKSKANKKPAPKQTPTQNDQFNSRMGAVPGLATGMFANEAYKPSEKLKSRTKYLVQPQLSKMLQDRLAKRKADNKTKPAGKGYTPSARTLAIAAMRKAQMSGSKKD